MTADEIRELIQLAVDTGIAELEVQRGENRVRIRRAVTVGQDILTGGSMVSPPAAPAAAPAEKSAAVLQDAQQSAQTPDPNLFLQKSPIVGTYYESPSPGGPPFVQVGERVQAGKVLCVIESMKLFNEIEAEIAGIVESKLVENGQPVEYGEALFAIRPV